MSLLAVFAYFTFRDSKTKSSTTEIKLPVGLSIPEYIDAAQKLADVLVNNSLAKLTQVKVCIGLNVTPSAAAANSDVQERAQFVFDAANGFQQVVYVPTLAEAAVLANTDALDTTNAFIANFIDFFETGNGTVAPVTMRNQDITALKYAREYFRRR